MRYEYHVFEVKEGNLGSLNEVLTDLGDQGFAIVHVGQDFAIMQREVVEDPDDDMLPANALYNLSEYVREILQIMKRDRAENRTGTGQLESKLVDAFKQLDEKSYGRVVRQEN